MFVGDLHAGSVREQGLAEALDAIVTAKTANLLRAEHLLHLRCELSCPNMLRSAQPLLDRADVRLLSVMDHTPVSGSGGWWRNSASTPRGLVSGQTKN
ncbi:MAG: hypothetical protein FJY37_05480 [Betaproteobacteria bacterium]|nr:hypothetical protein [Betaproteobacteria bacterium]